MKEWQLLTQAAEEMGLALSEKSLSKFKKFTDELLRVNAVMNLTAITELSDIIIKHYMDSLTPLRTGLFGLGAKVIDVGCGAGFPGIVLKIVREDLELTLMDGQNKRVRFLEETGRMLGFEKMSYLHGRAEEGAHKTELREKYDIAISRAVASFDVLCELCLPYVRVGGTFIAMKGPDPLLEIEKGTKAVLALGGQVEEILPMPLLGTDIIHSLVLVKKVEKTPIIYPRGYGKIRKKPL
jgi:16S rRNA (guanine527-N7)-methyltransferase